MTKKKAPTIDEWTLALREGKLAVVRAGLDAGFDPTAAPKPTWHADNTASPLFLAMRYGHAKIVQLLIERGADVNAADDDGVTPLMFSVVSSLPAAAAALLRAGADPSAKLPKNHPNILGAHAGRTALDLAKAQNENALVKVLSSSSSPRSAFDEKLDALRTAAFPVIDFEGSEEPVPEPLIGVDRPDHFSTIGKTGSDSMFALWLREPGAPLESAPVVYLDSEGDPQSVIAKNLDEFLSLLPYGTGHLYDLLQDPESDISKKLADAGGAEEDVEGEPFLKWWQGTFGVAPTKDPSKVIADAAKHSLDFKRWLSND